MNVTIADCGLRIADFRNPRLILDHNETSECRAAARRRPASCQIDRDADQHQAFTRFWLFPQS